jgi:hypothetical protein
MFVVDTTGLPNSQFGMVMSFGVAPEGTHPFALFSLQFFIPAFSAHPKLYKRTRDNGVWSSWETIGEEFDTDTITRLPKLFSPDAAFGSVSVNSISDPGVDYITNATNTPTADQFSVVSLGIGPPGSHDFDLYGVQLAIPAYSSNSLIYRRERDAGAWGSWIAIGNGVYLPIAGGDVSGRVNFSGANALLVAPSLTTAQRTAQATKTNGDVFYESTVGRYGVRVAGSDRQLIDSSGGQTINGTLTTTNSISSIRGSGTQNECFGSGAGSGLTTGYNNTFVGFNAGSSQVTNYASVAIGNTSNVSDAFNSIAIGSASSCNNHQAVAIGTSAIANRYCVAVGNSASANATGQSAVAIGASSAVTSTQGTAIGASAGATTGAGTTAVGYACSVTGSRATAVGSNLTNNTANRWMGGVAGAVSLAPDVVWVGHSTTTNSREMSSQTHTWVDSTDASRKSRVVYNVYDTAAREAFRTEASGTVAMVGFFGATAVVRPATGGAASTFSANTSGIADDTATYDGYTIGQVVKALRNLGLLT